MKKNIIIIVLSVVSALSLLFGFTQFIEAERQRDLVMVSTAEAINAKVLAERSAEEARRQTLIAEQVRLDCQERK
jgi:hypothetical protein